jgi:hypothetical protein
MEYRAVLHNPKNGRKTIESIWFSTRAEAEQTGKDGLNFYGATHYAIEESQGS